MRRPFTVEEVLAERTLAELALVGALAEGASVGASRSMVASDTGSALVGPSRSTVASAARSSDIGSALVTRSRGRYSCENINSRNKLGAYAKQAAIWRASAG